MKKLLIVLALILPVTTVHGQASLWWEKNVIDKDINGGVIAKDDTVEMEVKLNPNFTNIRTVFFDFQHQKDAIQLLSVERGAAIPQAASFNYTNNYYPNCKFNKTAQNTTTNGYNNWMNANYTCNASTVPYHAINRIMVNVASTNNFDQATYIKLRFKITNVSAGFPYDSVYMNFAVGYDANGNIMTNTENLGAKGVWIELAPGSNNLLSGEVKHSTNTDIRQVMRLSVTDTAQQPTEIANTLVGNSTFGFAAQLQPGASYRLRLMIPADSMRSLSAMATTVSDYTMAVQEFITQNLDRTFTNNHINKGIKYWAADVNNNNEFDGGDVQKLFNAMVGLDTLMKPPTECAANCYFSLPTIRGELYDTLGFESWKTLSNTSFTQISTTNQDQYVPLRYVLKGDVNLSHSSLVTEQQSAAIIMGNLVVNGAGSINVGLDNVIVTNNNITIPFNVNTNGLKLTGMQFEVKYDPTKVKFEKLEVNTPSWVSFVNTYNNGIIRFGAVDRDVNNVMVGNDLVPFKLHFSSLQPGADLSSAVFIYPTMDAADEKGKQVGIIFNTNTIKLIGANFFRSL